MKVYWLIAIGLLVLLGIVAMSLSVYQWLEKPMDYLGQVDKRS